MTVAGLFSGLLIHARGREAELVDLPRCRQIASQVVRPAVARGLQHEVVLELLLALALMKRPVDHVEAMVPHTLGDFV